MSIIIIINISLLYVSCCPYAVGFGAGKSHATAGSLHRMYSQSKRRGSAQFKGSQFCLSMNYNAITLRNLPSVKSVLWKN
jgi:hypothetical protein